MKECTSKYHIGNRLLPASEFRKHARMKDGLASQCRSCHDKINQRWRDKNREKIVKDANERKRQIKEKFDSWKSGKGCSKCGENDSVCLDLHHLDPEIKEYNIGDMIRRGFSYKGIMKEVEKCIVICSNCHRKLHRDKKLV